VSKIVFNLVSADDENAIVEKYKSIFAKLSTYQGLLEALFAFGNTLEMLYIGSMVLPMTNTRVERQKHSLIPLYVDFKSKKCHMCSRPIVDYKHGLFCSNIF